MRGNIEEWDEGWKRERRINGLGGNNGRRSGKKIKEIGGEICIDIWIMLREEGEVEMRMKEEEKKEGRFDIDIVDKKKVLEDEEKIEEKIIKIEKMNVDEIKSKVRGKKLRIIEIRRK